MDLFLIYYHISCCFQLILRNYCVFASVVACPLPENCNIILCKLASIIAGNIQRNVKRNERKKSNDSISVKFQSCHLPVCVYAIAFIWYE